MITASNGRTEVTLLSILLDEQTVGKLSGKFDAAVLLPLPCRTIRDKPKKAALQITRLRMSVPSGLGFLLSVRPILRPDATIVFQIVFPAPEFFAIGRPECFRAGLAATGVDDFMLLRAGIVEIGFGAVEQVTSAGANARAPLRPDFSIREILREFPDGAAAGFGRDIAGVREHPGLVQLVIQ